MSLTRFKRRGADGVMVDGPVSGAVVVIPVDFGSMLTGISLDRRIDLPLGASFELTDAQWSANTVTSDPSMTIGVTVAGAQIVAAVNLVTGTADGQDLTIVDGTVDEGEFIFVRITTDAGDSFDQGRLTLVGYLSAAPTSVRERDGDHY